MAHEVHDQHGHIHGAGHVRICHAGHVDYLHDGYLRYAHEGHGDDHGRVEVEAA